MFTLSRLRLEKPAWSIAFLQYQSDNATSLQRQTEWLKSGQRALFLLLMSTGVVM